MRSSRPQVRPAGVGPRGSGADGDLGLIKAVDRYDASQETPFEGYAWLLVLGELMHHVRDSERLLRAPRRVREMDRRWLRAERELWGVLGGSRSESDVARYVNANPSERREVREYRASGCVGFDGEAA